MSTPTAGGPVQRLLDAIRASDSEAFASLFGDNGVVDDWGRVFTGRDEVSGWNEREFIGLAAVLTIGQAQWGDDATVLTTDIATSGGYNGPATITLTVAADGKHITRMLLAD
ncbi:hypothetical protein ABIA33_000870 [Streptacidiphilus sp. MAP12-16]|uniref:nuclear transport factor 2 family protein n=1 Tax=Streptacidiphilus sp. MAP12-16 TaxID=3156300 RepID=UPI003515ECC6